jgi:mRNA interferase MazF
MKFKQFEIWIADLNPRFGMEPDKTRPVLIVQNNVLNNLHPSTVVCPITSNVEVDVGILRVNIKKGIGGIACDSAVMIDQIQTIDNRRLVKKIGTLPESINATVKNNLFIILDL